MLYYTRSYTCKCLAAPHPLRLPAKPLPSVPVCPAPTPRLTCAAPAALGWCTCLEHTPWLPMQCDGLGAGGAMAHAFLPQAALLYVQAPLPLGVMPRRLKKPHSRHKLFYAIKPFKPQASA